MIEKILERLEAERNEAKVRDDDYFLGKYCAYDDAIKIVKEVAGKDTNVPSRCDTCTHYVADEVPPICYMCSKGIEDNYERKGE